MKAEVKHCRGGDFKPRKGTERAQGVGIWLCEREAKNLKVSSPQKLEDEQEYGYNIKEY